MSHILVEIPADPVQAKIVLEMISRTGHVELAWPEGNGERVVRVPARTVQPKPMAR